MNGKIVYDAFMALEQIEKESSTNNKKSIILQNIDNQALYNFLYWTYNFNYHYYMNKVPMFESNIQNNDKSVIRRNIYKFKRLLSMLNARYITGNKSIDYVIKFLDGCDSLEKKWYIRILSRDLRCGISVTTINNIYGDVIDVFPVALAENTNNIIYPRNFSIEEKFDGYRCLCVKNDDGSFTMFSRNGKEIFGYDKILEELSFLETDNVVFDGELISNNFKGTQNTVFKKTNNKDATYFIFDCVPKDEFYSKNKHTSLSERIVIRNKNISNNFDNIVNVKPILYHNKDITCLRQDFAKRYKYLSTYKNIDKDKLLIMCDEAFSFALENNLEGIIIKDLDSKYMVGKSYSSECNKYEKYYSWTKRKPNETYDLQVVDVYEGTGINKDKLGGVYVEYLASDGNKYLVGVGSGFKQDEREKYWQNRNLIIGKTIEVVADSESSNSNGEYSLRFPRFKKIRKDK